MVAVVQRFYFGSADPPVLTINNSLRNRDTMEQWQKTSKCMLERQLKLKRIEMVTVQRSTWEKGQNKEGTNKDGKT